MAALIFAGIGVAVVVYLITRVRRWRARSRKPPADRVLR
jgi:hypothetical protein